MGDVTYSSDLIHLLNIHRPGRPVRWIYEDTDGPLSVASGGQIVDVAAENECVFVVVRRCEDEDRPTHMRARW